MDENTARLMEQLKQNPGSLKALLCSPDGQALLRMLNQGSGELRSAVRDASRGRPAEAIRLVEQFMQTQEGAALAQRLQRTFGQ